MELARSRSVAAVAAVGVEERYFLHIRPTASFSRLPSDKEPFFNGLVS